MAITAKSATPPQIMYIIISPDIKSGLHHTRHTLTHTRIAFLEKKTFVVYIVSYLRNVYWVE